MKNTISKSKIVAFPISIEPKMENDGHSSMKANQESNVMPFRNSLFGGLLSRSQGMKERFANGVRIIIEEGAKKEN